MSNSVQSLTSYCTISSVKCFERTVVYKSLNLSVYTLYVTNSACELSEGSLSSRLSMVIMMKYAEYIIRVLFPAGFPVSKIGDLTSLDGSYCSTYTYIRLSRQS